jgi:DNA-binding IclR family transcriptional regulator
MPDAEGRGVVEGAFRLLQALPDIDGPGQLGRLAQVTGIPRPSVYRLMAQLLAVGAVELRGDVYRLGTGMLELAGRVEPAVGLRRGALDVMQTLRERTGATVSLVARSGADAVVLEAVPGRTVLPVHIQSGTVMPAVAAGALVLDPSAAAHRVRRAHRAALDDEHTVPGLTCYASAIPLPDGTTAALQLTSNTSHSAIRLATLVHQAADRVAERIRTVR